MTDLEQRLAKLQKQFTRLKIMGGEGVTVQGSIRHGYSVELVGGASQSGVPGGGGEDVLGCTDPAADNFDPAATVDDGSCIYSCPSVTLVCDQICNPSPIEKCGYGGFVEGKIYLTQMETVDTDQTCNFGSGPFGDHSDCIQTTQGSASITSTFDPLTCVETNNDCVVIGAGTTTISASCRAEGACSGSFDACLLFNVYHASVSIPLSDGCGVNGQHLFGDMFSFPDDQTKIVSWQNWCTDYNSTYEVDLSDEYTTDALHTNAVAALPAYDDDFNDSCTASYNLSGDGTTLSICRFRYKWTFSTTVNFTLTWNEHTVFADMTTSDNSRTTEVSIGDTETTVFEALEPASNGTTTITDVVCEAHI